MARIRLIDYKSECAVTWWRAADWQFAVLAHWLQWANSAHCLIEPGYGIKYFYCCTHTHKHQTSSLSGGTNRACLDFPSVLSKQAYRTLRRVIRVLAMEMSCLSATSPSGKLMHVSRLFSSSPSRCCFYFDGQYDTDIFLVTCFILLNYSESVIRSTITSKKNRHLRPCSVSSACLS